MGDMPSAGALGALPDNNRTKSERIACVFTLDEKLIVRSWDDWLARVTGIKAADAIDRPLKTIFPDLAQRGIFSRFERVVNEGVVEVLAPAFHHYLFECSPETPSKYFDKMQQRVAIAPLLENDSVAGVIVTIEDVTARVEKERAMAEGLEAREEAVRLRAAESIALQDGLENVTPLVAAMGDESWRVRKSVVDGLARHGGQDAIKSLLRALRDQHRDLSVLNSALQVFALSGVDAVQPLAECLADSDTDLRIYAAHALGDQHDPRAVPALASALNDPDTNVRYHAIESLGKLRSPDVVDQLISIAESGDFFLVFPAIDALTKIGDSRAAASMVPLLEDEMMRAPAAEALGQLGDEETVAPLVRLLNKPGAPGMVVAQALAALYDRYEKRYQEGNYIADLARKAIAPSGARNLLDALEETGRDGLRSLALVLGWLEGEAVERALTRLLGHATARREVVEALVRHGARVTQLLIEQLDSDDLPVRQAALSALARIGDPRALPSLMRILTRDDESVTAAATALAKIGDRRAFEALVNLMGHPEPQVRQAVVAAINSIGHPDMAGRAMALLTDPNPHVRESAVKVAGYFGYSQCTELLVNACQDEDENVRRAAIEHIPYLEDPRGVSILAGALRTGTARVRASAAKALGQIEDNRVLHYLIAALNDPDQWTRYFAARSVGRRGYFEGMDKLAELAQSDPASQVRIAAMESLAQIGGPRAIAILAPLTESAETDMACAALRGLGLLGHPDALPPVLAALRSTDPERRLGAIQALGARGGAEAVDALQWAAGAADADAEIAQSAIDALAKLASPEAVQTLISLTADPARRAACIEALSLMGKDRVSVFAQGLRHDQPGVVRASIVEVLSRMKQTEASELLTTALNDEDASIRLAATNALARLGSRMAERKLVALARSDPDPNVRRAAHRALRK
ncbi:MAG TPA: HEAT repeat domain-containing protein [Blastocatellia bacterium]|nr:HEAT repeat domain-containing protein [Blastocatellia bacterium]